MIVLYILVGYIVPFLIGLGIYILFFVREKKIIKTNIREYGNQSIYSHKVNNYLLIKERKLAFFGGLLWPLTMIFRLGETFGEEFYKLHIKNNYENRLATWFF